jgi:hypothetical protein
MPECHYIETSLRYFLNPLNLHAATAMTVIQRPGQNKISIKTLFVYCWMVTWNMWTECFEFCNWTIVLASVWHTQQISCQRNKVWLPGENTLAKDWLINNNILKTLIQYTCRLENRAHVTTFLGTDKTCQHKVQVTWPQRHTWHPMTTIEIFVWKNIEVQPSFHRTFLLWTWSFPTDRMENSLTKLMLQNLSTGHATWPWWLWCFC